MSGNSRFAGLIALRTSLELLGGTVMLVEYKSLAEEGDDALEWFAVRVRSHCEWVVAASLKIKGFDVCLPLCRPFDRSKSRIKEIALFPGYVFCRFNRRVLLPILTVPNVVNIVSYGRIAQAVDPQEMLAIQKLAASGLTSAPHVYLNAGQRILVRNGPLEGVEGILVRDKGQDRLVISISLLLRSVIAEVDRSWVEAASVSRLSTPARTSDKVTYLARAV
jgi:transcription antitermination factor NusG